MTATQASNRKWDWKTLLAEVHAWQLYSGELGAPEMRDLWLSRLSDEERARYKQCPDNLRENYLAAHALCRATLSRYTGVEPSKWRFTTGPHGKPAVAAPASFKSLRFNLTHTPGLVVCAVSRAGEVGVDAEDASRPVDAQLIARHFFSEHELLHLERLPQGRRMQRFLEQWVLKEAYVKAVGQGLGNADERLTVLHPTNAKRFFFGGCQLALQRLDSGHIVACAVLSPQWRDIVQFEWLTASLMD